MVKNNRWSVNATDATAAEEIQIVETMATVAKLKSLAKVKTNGQPICRSLAASFKRSLATVYSSCFFCIARCEPSRKPSLPTGASCHKCHKRMDERGATTIFIFSCTAAQCTALYCKAQSCALIEVNQLRL